MYDTSSPSTKHSTLLFWSDFALSLLSFRTRLASVVRHLRWYLASKVCMSPSDWLCWGLTSQSTIFQSCRDGAIASWVINQYFRGVKCLAQGHNTAEVGLEPRTSRSGVRHSTTEPLRSPVTFRSFGLAASVHTHARERRLHQSSHYEVVLEYLPFHKRNSYSSWPLRLHFSWS